MKVSLDEVLIEATRLEKTGKFSEAQKAYEQAAAQEPANYRGWWELGHFLLRIDFIDKGLDALEKAQSLHVDNSALSYELANMLLSHGFAERGLKIVTSGLKEQPGNISLLFMQGVCYERLNRLDKAIGILEKVLKLSSGEPTVAAALGRCYRHEKDYEKAREVLEDCIARIENIEPRMDALWTELGMVRDKMGLYRQAFMAFTRAGQLTLAKPEVSTMDSSVMDKEIDNSQRWIVGGGMQKLTVRKPPSKRTHVFIVGFPRSGTTLTEQVLSSHSKISSSEEKPFLGEAARSLKNVYGANKSIPEILELCDDKSLDQARQAYWSEAEKHFSPDAEVFIDKLPLNIIYLGLINVVFPSAKIIVAIRDPRDVCLSCFFQDFSLNLSMKNFMTWPTTTAYYSKVMNFWLAVRSGLDLPWIEVKYEDTVADLPVQVKRMLEFIGVEFEDSMLTYYERTRDKFVATPSYQAIREPVHKGAVQRWRNYPGATKMALTDLQPFLGAFSCSE
jgi:tetratricopeptide (TPR) repeat protein